MDFLKFENIENNEKEKLIEIAYDHYFFELDELYYLENLKSPLKNSTFGEGRIILDKLIEARVPKHTKGYSELDNSTPFLKDCNPANFEPLTCYKLLLCSEYLSFCWYIPYTSMYKFFYVLNKSNKNIDIDIFIGKIKELYEKDDDAQFETFEKLTKLKYQKLKLNFI